MATPPGAGPPGFGGEAAGEAPMAAPPGAGQPKVWAGEAPMAKPPGRGLAPMGRQGLGDEVLACCVMRMTGFGAAVGGGDGAATKAPSRSNCAVNPAVPILEADDESGLRSVRSRFTGPGGFWKRPRRISASSLVSEQRPNSLKLNLSHLPPSFLTQASVLSSCVVPSTVACTFSIAAMLTILHN